MTYRAIAIAIDGSSESTAILGATMGALPRGIRVDVISVVPDIPLLSANPKLTDRVRGQLLERASQHIRGTAALFGIPPERVTIAVGVPAVCIEMFCRATHADLLVLGLHVRDPGHEGATAMTLLRCPPCDILTVRI